METGEVIKRGPSILGGFLGLGTRSPGKVQGLARVADKWRVVEPFEDGVNLASSRRDALGACLFSRYAG